MTSCQDAARPGSSSSGWQSSTQGHRTLETNSTGFNSLLHQAFFKNKNDSIYDKSINSSRFKKTNICEEIKCYYYAKKLVSPLY